MTSVIVATPKVECDSSGRNAGSGRKSVERGRRGLPRACRGKLLDLCAVSCVTKPGPVMSTGFAIVFKFVVRSVNSTIGR